MFGWVIGWATDISWKLVRDRRSGSGFEASGARAAGRHVWLGLCLLFQTAASGHVRQGLPDVRLRPGGGHAPQPLPGGGGRQLRRRGGTAGPTRCVSALLWDLFNPFVPSNLPAGRGGVLRWRGLELHGVPRLGPRVLRRGGAGAPAAGPGGGVGAGQGGQGGGDGGQGDGGGGQGGGGGEPGVLRGGSPRGFLCP